MIKRKGIAFIFCLLFLLIFSITSFIGCDNPNDPIEIDDNEISITGDKGLKITITSLNKNKRTSRFSFYSESLKTNVTAKGEFAVDFSTITFSDIEPSEAIDSIGSTPLKVENGEITLLNQNFNLTEIISKLHNVITVHFDENKIRCKKSPDIIIKSGTIVKEGDMLLFNTINLPAGNVVKKWIIGTQERENEPYAIYHVSKAEANSENKINVDYEIKAQIKMTIIFDDKKVICKKNTQEIATGSDVFEQDRLNFKAKNIAVDKVAVWKIKGKEPWGCGYNSLVYDVEAEDGNSDKEINLVYSERDKEKITIKFDESKFNCVNKETNEVIKSENKILEGVELKFSTISGKDIKWKFGSSSSGYATNEITFTVYKGKANKENIIVAGIKE